MNMIIAAIQGLNQIRRSDIFWFVMLTAATVGFTTWYVSQEQYYYFWDYSRYSQQLNDLISKTQKSPIDGVLSVLISLLDDYTQLPLLLMLPTRILLGDSRVSFIVSIVLAYGVPFSLMMGTVVARMVKFKQRLAFWIAAIVALLLPAVWVPMLRGFPDLGGAILLWLPLLIYWKDVFLKQRSHHHQIAMILALSVLFRRHFVYGVRSFLLTIIIFSLLHLASQHPLPPLWSAIKAIFVRVGRIAVLFAAFTFVVFFKALLINYRVLYASYEVSTRANFDYYVQSFGWIFWLLTILGFTIGSRNSGLHRIRVSFVGLWGIVSVFQWMFFAKQVSVQYTTHFAPFIVIGLSLLIWRVKTTLQRPVLATVFSVMFATAVLGNMVIGLSRLGKVDRRLEPFFSRHEPPLQRADYSVIATLVNDLRQRSLPEQQIYVASSSYTLNSSVLTVAEQQQLGQQKLRIIKPANIDSRDFYPLNGLLKSHYVVVATPPQYHVEPREQQLVQSVVTAFEQHQAIAQDFRPLSDQFGLEKGVNVKIYERIRPTSFQTILQTLAFLKAQVPRQPASEPNWLTLASEQRTDITKELLLNQVFISRLSVANDPPTSLLYFGVIPPSGILTGRIKTSKCMSHERSRSIVLTLSTLTESGVMLSRQSVSYIDPQYQPFKFRLPESKPALLRLDLRMDGTSAASCQVELSFIQVSQS